MNKFLIFIKKKVKEINIFLRNNQTVSFFSVFFFFSIIYIFIYMKLPVLSSSDDHYFHFRFAEKLLQNGFFDSFRDFKSIYFSNIAQGKYFIYYNFLFYIILLPFSFISPLYLGIKLYAILVASFFSSIIYYFLKKINIKYSFFWTIGFFAVIGLGSFFRIFLSRPYVFAPAFVLLITLAIYKKKYFWVFVLTFLYLFWHTATFLLPLMVGLVYFIISNLYEKKYNWNLLLVVVSGTLLSIAVVSFISAGFFNNIYFNVIDLLNSIFLDHKINIPEGNELYPKNLFDLLDQNMFLFVMFISAVLFFIFTFFNERSLMLNFNNILKQKRILTFVLFFFSSLFFIAIPNISNRFTDFFVLFAWIFIVIVFSETFSNFEFKKYNFKKFTGYVILVCLFYLFLNNLLHLNQFFAINGSRPQEFSEIGRYLSENLNKGDIVYNVTWNWFPQLYYYAPEQNYVIGLEPRLLYLYNKKLYWLWSNIANGYVCEYEMCRDLEIKRNRDLKKEVFALRWEKDQGDKIAEIMKKDFKTHYIVSSRDYKYLNIILENNKNFKKVLNSNNNYYIYKILD